MDGWRLITTWGADPSFNMGLDEALLEGQGSPPTLRLYTWQPDTLSLGYFQPWASVPAISEASAVVRRITGGGAIHHKGELTLSLTCALDHPLYRGTVADSYERVHRAIAVGLSELGVQAHLRGDESLSSDRESTGMCFHASTPLDLVWGGRKGVGSAQRRRLGRVLHHGSIKLTGSALEGEIATAAGAGAEVTPEGFAPVLLSAFSTVLGIETLSDVPSAQEREDARRLAKRYVEPAFLKRR